MSKFRRSEWKNADERHGQLSPQRERVRVVVVCLAGWVGPFIERARTNTGKEYSVCEREGARLQRKENKERGGARPETTIKKVRTKELGGKSGEGRRRRDGTRLELLN